MGELIPQLALSQAFRVTDGGLEAADTAQHDGRLLSPNTVIDGKYTVISLLGSGGMGAIYRALHMQLDKEVALKTFMTGEISPEAWLRFQREARAIAKLDDINIVKVFDFGIGENNLPYYTMELLDGQSLAEKLASSRPLSRDQALAYFTGVARGLLHAHRLQMVHRDIKPANIFLCTAQPGAHETVKLVDFGIAKLVTNHDLDSQRLTSTGLVFGSPLYMSPEQSLGHTVDERSDIYSFGCTFYEALTGKPPFAGATAFATTLMHQTQPAPKLADQYPQGVFEQRLESFVAKLQAKSPDSRYQSLEEVLEALQTIETISPTVLNNAPSTVPLAERSQNSSAPIVQSQSIIDTGANTVEMPSAKGGGSDFARLSPRVVLISAGVFCVALATGIVLAFGNSNAPSARVKSTMDSPLHRTTQTPSWQIGPSESYFRGLEPHGEKRFVFPVSKTLGVVSYPTTTKIPRRNASGTMYFPPGAQINFQAGSAVEERPELLAPFAPDSLSSLQFTMGFNISDAHFRQIEKLTSLTNLKIIEGKISPANIETINKLPNLISLELPDCQGRSEDLLKVKRLQNLHILALDSYHHVQVLLPAISTSQIEDLSLSDCALKDEDLKMLAKMKRCVHLRVGQNDFTNAGLRYLIKMPFLIGLDLEGIKLEASCIDIFKAMHLEHLKLNTESWNAADRARLRAVLPTCDIHECGKTHYRDLDE